MATQITKSVADVLEEAADLIAAPGAWTQGAAARDAHGQSLSMGTEVSAVCWCLLGAIGKAVGSAGHPLFGKAQIEFEGLIPEDEIPDGADEDLPPEAQWNDAPERTQAEVVAKLREAAAKARAAQVQA